MSRHQRRDAAAHREHALRARRVDPIGPRDRDDLDAPLREPGLFGGRKSGIQNEERNPAPSRLVLNRGRQLLQERKELSIGSGDDRERCHVLA